jgi:hypothetical protein
LEHYTRLPDGAKFYWIPSKIADDSAWHTRETIQAWVTEKGATHVKLDAILDDLFEPSPRSVILFHCRYTKEKLEQCLIFNPLARLQV